MKWKKAVFILFVTLLVLGIGSINVFAMNTGFSTSEMSAKDQQTFLSNIRLSTLSNEPQKGAIACFDVWESGLIAVGTAVAENKYILVYNAAGEFQYGYSFQCNQSFGIQWDNENIMIYFVRSDVAASFCPDGTPAELKRIENTVENNSYWDHFVFAEEKTVGNNRYILNNRGLLNVFAFSYSQLLRIDQNGTETLIYDVSKAQTVKAVFIMAAVLIFVAVVVAGIVRQFYKIKRP